MSKKKKLVIVFIILAFGLLLMRSIAITTVNNKKMAEQTQLDKIMSEVHSKLDYLMFEGTAEEQMAATSRLIAHVMSSGCSTAYESLLDRYDKNSLTYLQDFLNGRTCKDYITPNVVTLEEDEYYTSYKVIAGTNSIKYRVQINKNTDSTPSHFQIELYEEQKLYK